MTQTDDKEHYRKEHMLIFGHYPVPDLSGGHQCAHPVHDALQGMMNQPGVDVEIPFNSHEVTTEDDPEALRFQEMYEEETQKWRDIIQEEEERQAFNEKRRQP